MKKTYNVEKTFNDMRIDRWIRNNVKKIPQSLIEKNLRKGKIKLNGKKVNVLIFPNLESANITYKILKQLDGNESIGPILLGLKKPAHVLQLGSSVDEMVNMAAVAVVDAQQRERQNK